MRIMRQKCHEHISFIVADCVDQCAQVEGGDRDRAQTIIGDCSTRLSPNLPTSIRQVIPRGQ
jgi:hypothetical protein